MTAAAAAPMAVWMRRLTLGALAGLLLLVLGWALGWWPQAGTAVPAMAVFALPLLAPLRGMLAHRARAHVWAALLALLYLLHGLVTLMGGAEDRFLGTLEALLAVLLLLGAALQARWLALHGT